MTGLFPSRAVRWLLLIFACLATISLFLLATASANTSLFARHYDLLLLLNTGLVVLLMALVGYQLLRLRRNLGRGVFGSRLALRLVLLFALVAVLPGALVYAVSVQFLGKSIESWFDVRVDRALEGGLNLGRNALDYLLKETAHKAGQMAITLGEQGAGAPAMRLSRVADQAGVAEAVLFSASGAVLAVAGVATSTAAPEPPPAAAIRRARLQQASSAIEQGPEGTLLLRVVVPVNVDDRLEPLRLLQVVEPVPRSLAQDAEKVQAGWRDYQEISFSRQSLKKLYALTLTLTLLLALTSALGLAVVLSEKFSEPLGLLAEGTRAVAQGDFTRRQPVTSRDELGVLTESFNTMTEQLSDAHAKAEESRRATETTRAYLQSILGNLSAGVLAFDDHHRLRTANASAAVILQQPLAELSGVPIGDWGARLPALNPFAELVSASFRESPDGQWQLQAELEVAGVTRMLLLRGSQLPVEPVAGYVVVFDDVTDLAQAQRDAAWGEVARRLAHEIKNPLTPIQLSAERLEFKLSPEARRRRPGDAAARRGDDRRAGRGDEAHGRRLRRLRAPAAPRPDAAGGPRRPLAGRAGAVRESASAGRAVAAGRAPRRPGRADAAAPGHPQSAAERHRRPVRQSGPALRNHARGTRGRRGAHLRRQRLRVRRRRAAPGLRALRDHQGEGHGPRPRDRQEDRRGTPRPRRAREPRAARRAGDADFSPRRHRRSIEGP